MPRGPVWGGGTSTARTGGRHRRCVDRHSFQWWLLRGQLLIDARRAEGIPDPPLPPRIMGHRPLCGQGGDHAVMGRF